MSNNISSLQRDLAAILADDNITGEWIDSANYMMDNGAMPFGCGAPVFGRRTWIHFDDPSDWMYGNDSPIRWAAVRTSDAPGEDVVRLRIEITVAVTTDLERYETLTQIGIWNG